MLLLGLLTAEFVGSEQIINIYRMFVSALSEYEVADATITPNLANHEFYSTKRPTKLTTMQGLV